MTGLVSLELLEGYTSSEKIRVDRRSQLISVIATAARCGRSAAEKTCDKLLAAAKDAAVFGHRVESDYYLIRHFVRMI